MSVPDSVRRPCPPLRPRSVGQLFVPGESAFSTVGKILIALSHETSMTSEP